MGNKRKDPFIVAVIPAAGRGSRMQASVNKQYLELGGMPVLARTLSAFEHHPGIDRILVVAGGAEQEQIRVLCRKYEIGKFAGVVEGGATRQDSVRNALDHLAASLENPSSAHQKETCYVLIHDGARPFVSREVIDRCIQGAIRYNACGAGVSVKDTMKQVDESGRILCTVPRDSLRAIQTPQAFHFPMIYRLHNRALHDGLSFTDDTSIAEYYGEKVFMVDGDYCNIKITTPEDLLYGEVLLRQINRLE